MSDNGYTSSAATLPNGWVPIEEMDWVEPLAITNMQGALWTLMGLTLLALFWVLAVGYGRRR